MNYQERVIQEHQDLSIKIQALSEFIESGKVHELESTDAYLLIEQLRIMEDYAKVLKRRIDRF